MSARPNGVSTAATVEAERAGAQEAQRAAWPSWRSPFLVGMFGAAGVAVTYAGVRFVYGARAVLTLIGIAVFLAVGLDPVVRWLQRRGLPRWAAVTAVALGTVAVLAGILAAALPPLVRQAAKLTHETPTATSGSSGPQLDAAPPRCTPAPARAHNVTSSTGGVSVTAMDTDAHGRPRAGCCAVPFASPVNTSDPDEVESRVRIDQGSAIRRVEHGRERVDRATNAVRVDLMPAVRPIPTR